MGHAPATVRALLRVACSPRQEGNCSPFKKPARKSRLAQVPGWDSQPQFPPMLQLLGEPEAAGEAARCWGGQGEAPPTTPYYWSGGDGAPAAAPPQQQLAPGRAQVQLCADGALGDAATAVALTAPAPGLATGIGRWGAGSAAAAARPALPRSWVDFKSPSRTRTRPSAC